jgi:hypothetical protein
MHAVVVVFGKWRAAEAEPKEVPGSTGPMIFLKSIINYYL